MTNQQRKWNDVDNKCDALAIAKFAYLVSLLLLPTLAAVPRGYAMPHGYSEWVGVVRRWPMPQTIR